MTTVTDRPSTGRRLVDPPRPLWRWMPRLAFPAVAAVAVVAAVVLGGRLGGATPALAAVQEAARESSGYDSGQTLTEIEVNALDEDPELQGTIGTIRYRFDGDRSEEVATFDDGDATIIRIGDDVYHQGIHLNGEALDEEAPFILSSASSSELELPTGMSPESSKPASILPLIERADDFEQTSSVDNQSVYSGTIKTSVLNSLSSGDVPAGLSGIVVDLEEGNDHLPDTLDVTVVVEDEKLTRLEIVVQGETGDGYVDVVLTTTFGEFGEPQDIAAPPSDQVVAEADFFSLAD